jgi:rSAM/selenodomain-associated transferase 1
MNRPSKPDSPDHPQPLIAGPKGSSDELRSGPQILGLMTKYWTAGQVKTRLGSSIGMEAAASIHHLFTSHLCQSLCQTADQRDLCIAPDQRADEVRKWLARQELPGSWTIVPQGEGDLGQRMSRWFARNLTTSSTRGPRCILIGADCPTLQSVQIRTASEHLARHDVVIGPAVDGGYYLIGLSGPWNHRLASLFLDVPWSGPDVCRITCDRAARSGLSLAQLGVAEDVDTMVELDHLRSQQVDPDSSDQHKHLLCEIENILAKSPPQPKATSK